jgi:acetolactate synthase-1/2/3 large subunit
MKYSDLIANWLHQSGYSHCFTVGGGNIMHLTNSIAKKLKMVPVVNEVAAGIASEYFNEISAKHKSVVLVTAGPGLTNLITAISGAYLESRELLILAGQVKTTDLKNKKQRQNGIQEIDGISLVSSITKKAKCIKVPVDQNEFLKLAYQSKNGKKGPVVLEIPIDIQAREIKSEIKKTQKLIFSNHNKLNTIPSSVTSLIEMAERPILLLGAGVSRQCAASVHSSLKKLKMPIMVTWNAADRYPAVEKNYFGRPNTWGMRYSNVILQQSDLLIAVGSRLGLQQTGFNYKEFLPVGKIIHVDLDQAELDKKTINKSKKLNIDADCFLRYFLNNFGHKNHNDWLDYSSMIKSHLPVIEFNQTGKKFISPFHFVEQVSNLAIHDDIIIPCSSGGAFTVTMQTFMQKKKQFIISNKALASMGYGLSGAIGASIAYPKKRTILFEGDGGFSQNLQELGTVSINNLNLKIFIFSDQGYASIRATQKNYFNGNYVGCDESTGLGLPNWELLSKCYKIGYYKLKKNFMNDKNFIKKFTSPGPTLFVIPIDPKQTYYPKITSRVTANGMESNPLHLMTPALSDDLSTKVFKYLKKKK